MPTNLSHLQQVLDHKTVLLDSNFLIDSYRSWDSFGQVIKEFESYNVVLTTNSLVALEVVKGVRSPEEFEKKTAFVNRILKGFLLPVTKDTTEIVLSEVIKLYGIQGSAHITDLHLAASAIQYKDSTGVLILTRDYKDFPTTIFDLMGTIPVECKPEACIYGLYKYSEEKALNILSKYS